ncbi:DNA-binding CsgD family transcriptional regulator [Rhodoblastus acidophilus]|uniref:helix-turn-helix transcriptional regulator n=1 Tax=Rhodoblastus acidophilus TaxID=1074 RepID=UPI0022249E08|nr:helix-turn-helix transcriptional regulator [Rhodoblastus acidophilus]MCW2285297.1 DNA-binding CsgD family transcriptional regulator [Rhodoblastus acidophilus]MCW2334253.1 DNA-binding CsgD family transcriptional regulator [Rhodoblastus acidophilus]
MGRFEALTDQIYEAAIVPELWPNVLQSFCRASSSFGGALFATNPHFSGWVSSPQMVDLVQAFFEQGWAEKNLRTARAVQRGLFGFVSDHDLLSPAEMETDPTYRFLRENGGGWCAGIVTPVPSGDNIVFSWERPYVDGPFSREEIESFNAVAGPLRRAALVAARLGLEKARAAAETLRALGLPAAVLSRSHKILLTNDLFERFMPSLFQDGAQRCLMTDQRADALLKAVLERLKARHWDSGVLHSLPVTGRLDRPPMVVHVVPILRAAQDVFSSAACLLVVTELSRNAAPEATILRGLFDLTPAEARVAQAVAEGMAPVEIAAEQDVSIGTVRTHLKSAFAKTGTTRQAELAVLLSRTRLP